MRRDCRVCETDISTMRADARTCRKARCRKIASELDRSRLSATTQSVESEVSPRELAKLLLVLASSRAAIDSPGAVSAFIRAAMWAEYLDPPATIEIAGERMPRETLENFIAERPGA